MQCVPSISSVCHSVLGGLLLCLLCMGVHEGVAQGHDGRFGNEWIDYTPGKTYYKVRVAKDGWYRIPASTLQQAGVTVRSLPLEGLQLFHEGQEVPIHVERNGNNLLYVQFYGE